MPNDIEQKLQSFVDARGRPALFFLSLSYPIGLPHVLAVRSALNDYHFDELDFVINSLGGDINSAYQIAELLRLHTKRLNACVPLFAKSAATLLCISADLIVIDEVGQLGPLDSQIEEEAHGKKTYVSALNPFKTLGELRQYSLKTVEDAVELFLARTQGNMSIDDCLKHSVEYCKATTAPLLTQVSTEKLGEYARVLSVGKEYASQLLGRCRDWDEQKAREVAERLVFSYPSHEYVVDYHQLREMGFMVELFEGSAQQAIRLLEDDLLSESSVLIQCVLPNPASAKEHIQYSKTDMPTLVLNRDTS